MTRGIWAENVQFPGNTIMFQQRAPSDCFSRFNITFMYNNLSCFLTSNQPVGCRFLPSNRVHNISSQKAHVTGLTASHILHPAGRSDLGIHSDIINMDSCAFEWAETKLRRGWHRGRVSIQHGGEQQRHSRSSACVRERPSEWKQHRVTRSHQDT